MKLLAVVEGDTDIPVVRALARSAGWDVDTALDMGGKSQLDLRLAGFNEAAKGHPWFVLRDLDDDARCAGGYLSALGLQPSKWMVYRIAMREVEAWLLADTRGISRFLGIPEERLPVNPDLERDPTRKLVDLARRYSKSRIRAAMVPAPRAAAQVGPLYEATMIEFAVEHWSVERAMRKSDSLRRAHAALKEMAHRWGLHLSGSR